MASNKDNNELYAMMDRKNASIGYFNATNVATQLLDMLTKSKLLKPKNADEALEMHRTLRDATLVEHNRFSAEVLSRMGNPAEKNEVDAAIEKASSIDDVDKLRTFYLTMREALRGDVLVRSAVQKRKLELTGEAIIEA